MVEKTPSVVIEEATLVGKVALVTGASRGLGAATARSLARAGCKVGINYRTDQDSALRVAHEIREEGGQATVFCADITSEADIKDMQKKIVDLYGPVQILINNAGWIPRPSDWRNISAESLRKTVAVNLTGPMQVIQAFADDMIAERWGRIVNITSTYCYTGSAEILAYTAAKAGIIPITYALARELGAMGITVNAVAPGNFETDMIKGAPQGYKSWVEESTPLGRFGRPAEVASAVLYLCCAEFITGHVLTVDGGHLLNM